MGFFKDLVRRAQGLPTEKDFQNALDALQNQIIMLNALAVSLDKINCSDSNAMNLTFALRMDLMNFALHIASSDGILEPSEVDAINSFLGTNLSYSECKFAIDEMGLGSHMFSRELPVSFEILTQIAVDVDADAKKFADNLIGTYRNLGAVIAMVDGEVDVRETQDLNRYISMLERYASTF